VAGFRRRNEQPFSALYSWFSLEKEKEHEEVSDFDIGLSLGIEWL
jgi:hypothetical protein